MGSSESGRGSPSEKAPDHPSQHGELANERGERARIFDEIISEDCAHGLDPIEAI